MWLFAIYNQDMLVTCESLVKLHVIVSAQYLAVRKKNGRQLLVCVHV